MIQVIIPTCCGKVRVLQFCGAPDEAEAAPAAAADGPSGNGHGGVDCAHAGCGGAVGLMLTCWKVQPWVIFTAIS